MAPQTGFGFLVPDRFVLEDVTRNDIVIASLAWGFTIGFGWLTTWTALKQTKQMWRRHGSRTSRNAYIWMIWLEILVCLIFGLICFLYLLYIIPPSFEFYFIILTTWALQVQFLLQIIVNRCAILLTDTKKANRLKIGVAVLITLVNISVYNIWIPARLQISDRYIWINEWWDRIEKGIYLLVDAALNFYFIRIVKHNLIKHGLTKYRTLMHFNMFIVGFSLCMDVMIIAMMSLPNTFVYMQFHPLAYIVKLNIEMSMAELIGKIARNRNCGVISQGDFSVSVGSDPSTGNADDMGDHDSRYIIPDFEAEARGRRHAQFVAFELRTVETGAELGPGTGTRSTHERSRFTSNNDTLGSRRGTLASNKWVPGLQKPTAGIYPYESYGVGIQSKEARDMAEERGENTNIQKGEERASSGTSHGGEDDVPWVQVDLDRSRDQVTSRDGILIKPSRSTAEWGEKRTLASIDSRNRKDGKRRSRSRSRGWSSFRRPPPRNL